MVTDHRPLCKILEHNQGVPSSAAARMQRWALILSAYQYTLQYIPGSQNQCADCMSRLPTPCYARDTAEYMSSALAMDISSLPVTARDIAKATCKDCVLAVVLQSVRHGQWSMPVSEGVTPFIDGELSLVAKMVVYCGVKGLLFQRLCSLVCYRNFMKGTLEFVI